ncbi:NAD(P)H-dependent oxidoreductase [Pseudooceanicola sp. CBS1P-1]|nr:MULTISPECIES: NAD(P)H-dependent oxidoreductase [Pseudooceanicola]MBT9386579.1 NAD(P)H-dependent oxidoreductase [Pseudooceanicola endophyticus]
MKITIVVGNPKPASRTGKLAQKLVERMFGGADPDLQVIDLVEHVDQLFVWPSERMAALNARVAESDLAVFASPTYKASYTGLLKSFLDRYPMNGLNRVPSLAFMTGGGLAHSLAPTTTLVPLLHELGAVVPYRGLYFNTERMDAADEILDDFAREVLLALGRCMPVIQATAPQIQAAADAEKMVQQEKAHA